LPLSVSLWIPSTNKLRHARVNVYYNTKSVRARLWASSRAAALGQAATNDKAGQSLDLFTARNARSIKENYVG